MSETGSGTAPKGNGLVKWGIVGLAVVGIVAVLYVIVAASFKPSGPANLAEYKKGELAQLIVPTNGKPAPDVEIYDASGKPLKLSDFKGNVVVLNLWATWCAPCIKELPSLGRLEAAYSVAPVKVIAVSIDRPDKTELVRTRLASAPPLAEYRDPKYRLAFGLDPQPPGFPTTIIYDRKGIERARLQKDADWNSPDVRALVDALLAEK